MVRRGNFSYLLGGLLFYLLIAPLTYDWSRFARQLIITAPLTIAMILAVWSLPRNSATRRVGIGLIAPSDRC